MGNLKGGAKMKKFFRIIVVILTGVLIVFGIKRKRK